MVLPNCLVNQIKLLFSDKIFTSSSLSKAIRDNEKYLVQLRCYLNFHPEYEKLSNLIICICKDIKPRKCLICNKPIKYKTIRQHLEAKYCSLKCKQSEKALKLMVLNTKKTLKEKYNVNNIWEIPGHREKVESTCLKNFNCKSPLKNKVVQEQIKKNIN